MTGIEIKEIQKRNELHKNDINTLIGERESLIRKLRESYDRSDEYGALADEYEAKYTMTKIACDRFAERVRMLEQAMYTAHTPSCDGDARCFFCKFGAEGTERESGYIPPEFDDFDSGSGEPEDELYCNRCASFTIDQRGAWEFDDERFLSVSDTEES